MARALSMAPRMWRRLDASAWLVVIAVLLLTPDASSAAVAPVTIVGARPAAFVPDWDGHTDSSVVSYRITAASIVEVSIVDAGGRVQRRLDSGLRAAGTHLLAWDGRDDAGTLLTPGTYQVQVAARLLRSGNANEPEAAMLGTRARASVRTASVRVQAPPVTLSSVRLDRTVLSRARAHSQVSMRFRLSHHARVTAAVVDTSTGTVVRNLGTHQLHAGANQLLWDGMTDQSTPAAEGNFDVVIAASTGGRPTGTLHMPISIDVTPPRLGELSRLRARNARTGVMIPLEISLHEAANVTVRIGRRATRRTIAAGTHRISVSGAELGIIPVRRPRSIRMSFTAVDSAGNASTTRTTLRIPAVAAPTSVTDNPSHQPPVAPTTEITQPGAALPWPVSGGIITSEFGMRWGRPHTGLDIAVPIGTPVHPVADGRIAFVGAYGGYGNLVMVDHASGLRTYYAHLSRFGAFAEGATVTRADVIGAVGCTGRCFGPHLHFETRVNGVPQPPQRYLKPS